MDDYYNANAVQHGPTMIIDRQVSLHNMARQQGSNTSTPPPTPEESLEEGSCTIGMSLSGNNLMDAMDETLPMLSAPPVVFARNYNSSGGSLRSNKIGPLRSIRFQVIIWYIGPVDVVLGRVPVKVRITMFWNDTDTDDEKEDCDSVSSSNPTMWKMQGRRRASLVELNDAAAVAKTVNVPPISILNAVSFTIIDHPEVNVLREDTKLMRWSCLYDAILLQDNIRVDDFPHDKHDIVLKIGILSQRQKGNVWDKRKWRLGLATEHDSMGTTRVPHGLIVDDVKIPEFHYDKDKLMFEFPYTRFGSDYDSERDRCLQLRLHVVRNSGYYDQNIMPMLAALNLVSMSIIYGLEATGFFMRGLLLLNIAFTQMGIRMTVDSHLPNVGYQIKMQRILNQFFFTLLILVLESSVVYVLNDRHDISIKACDRIDLAVVGVAMVHSTYTVVTYYREINAPGGK